MFNWKTSKGTLEVVESVVLPIGSFIRIDNRYYYNLTKGYYLIPTKSILDSWAPARVIQCTGLAPETVGVLGFRDGSLIRDMKTANIYFISGGKRRQVTNPLWLNIFGIRKSEIPLASQYETSLHLDGEDLD